MKLRLLFTILLLLPVLATAENLEEYLTKNNEIAIQFLSSLKNVHIGKSISGIPLTDLSNPLDDYIYIGKNTTLQGGLNIYLFKSPDRKYEAYLWIADGEPFTLPKCDTAIVNEGVYVLSGDVYTWKSLQPGHGVVQLLCPELGWVQN